MLLITMNKAKKLRKESRRMKITGIEGSRLRAFSSLRVGQPDWKTSSVFVTWLCLDHNYHDWWATYEVLPIFQVLMAALCTIVSLWIWWQLFSTRSSSFSKLDAQKFSTSLLSFAGWKQTIPTCLSILATSAFDTTISERWSSASWDETTKDEH